MSLHENDPNEIPIHVAPEPKALVPQGEPVIESRATIMAKLTQTLSLNDLGLPDFIYRTDCIPVHFYEEDTTEAERISILQAASLPLEYFEGYPTQSNGSAFWSKMEFEPQEAYHAFNTYLGIVEISDDSGSLVAPVRTFGAVAAATRLSESDLKDLANMFYWKFRAKAYDMFMVASFSKQKERRSLILEDNHFKVANRWIDKLEKKAEEMFNDEDAMEDLKPKEVLSLMLDFAKYQRVTVGLPANGGQQTKDDVPKNASLEVSMRTVAKQAGEESKTIEMDSQGIEQLLDDPESAQQMQELIIKANTRK